MFKKIGEFLMKPYTMSRQQLYKDTKHIADKLERNQEELIHRTKELSNVTEDYLYQVKKSQESVLTQLRAIKKDNDHINQKLQEDQDHLNNQIQRHQEGKISREELLWTYKDLGFPLLPTDRNHSEEMENTAMYANYMEQQKANAKKASDIVDNFHKQYPNPSKYHQDIESHIKSIEDIPADIKEMERLTDPGRYSIWNWFKKK
eukprot:TRINITY_DN5730_c0_g1_i1.p1 TRINITY_DN5730_c0_g1~~TRINITY_DN5730_c0_g1_i1.p1  ORF type:complete len:204 (+),score=39.80 TRINITY_DN5730_c0_g1_i1:375-986(+)